MIMLPARRPTNASGSKTTTPSANPPAPQGDLRQREFRRLFGRYFRFCFTWLICGSAAFCAKAAAGETSDRSPGKHTQSPQAQQDRAGGKTSDRSKDKNVKVEHQPGAAGSSRLHLRRLLFARRGAVSRSSGFNGNDWGSRQG